MVKNYLVSAVRPITQGWHLEKNKNLYQNYQLMYDMSLASFKQFLQEPFESICWSSTVQDNEQYTFENWKCIRDLWHSEPCNILWAGADTMMLQPTSLFTDRFREYRMFNYTDPKSCNEFAHFFNNDIQYFPHTMSEKIWELGEKLWQGVENHPMRNWGFDQLRNNYMFFAQDIPDSDRLHPKLAYQCLGNGPTAYTDQWNGVSINHAHILHFHGSRNSRRIVEVMTVICRHLGINHALDT